MFRILRRPPKPRADEYAAAHASDAKMLALLDEPPKPKPLGEWDQAIDKLIAETRSGELKWRETSVTTNDERPGLMYATEVLDKSIVVYLYQYKDWITGTDFEWKLSATVRFLTGSVCMSRWQNMTDRPFWLFHAVEEQLCGTETFLKDYLK